MEPINVEDYEALARERLEPFAWDYFAGGSGDEVTLRANREAFGRLRLRPRMLVDVSTVDLRTTALGTPVTMPIFVAPMAYQRLANAEGEITTARGSGEAGALMVASTMSTRTLEEIATAATGPLWFQLYVYKNRAVSEALVRRAEAAGYRALVLTVDAPRLGRRERDVRNSFTLPADLSAANFAAEHSEIMRIQTAGASALAVHAAAEFDTSLTWEALSWLRSVTKLPVVVKGILTGEDAEEAVSRGADGIIVSNHGGRQLDSAPAGIEALPEVVEAASGSRTEIYMDGGVRRGTDVLKALALGARAVLVGRPVLWGLAADGEVGVRRVLELLRDELELAMALAGRPTIESIDRSLVRVL